MRPRVTIFGMGLAVAACALALAALVRPSTLRASLIYSATVASLVLAALRAACGEGRRPRAFWAGFGLAGGTHLLLAFQNGWACPPNLIKSFL